MAYTSGEFSAPGVNGRPVPGAVAYFDQKLWLIGCGSGLGEMYQTTLSLEQSNTTIDIQGGAAKESSNWSTSALGVPSTSTGAPLTQARCGAAPLGATLYLVWTGPTLGGPVGLLASQYSMTGEGALKWGDPIQLQDQNGNLLRPKDLTVDASVTAFGTDTLIVASPSVPCPTQPGTPLSVYVGAFDVNSIDFQNSTWTASSEVWTTPAQIQLSNCSPKDTGLKVSIDWFNASGGPTGTPPFWLWVTLMPDGLNGNGAFFLVPLDGAGNPSPGGVDGFYIVYESPSTACAIRDPAGRLRTYASIPQDKLLQVLTYNTYGPPDPNPKATTPLPQAQSDLGAASADQVPPSVGFFTDMNGGQAVTVNGQAGTQYPVYEFIFYGSDVKCQVNLFGYAQVLPGYASFTPTPKVAETVIIAGIVDAPIPVPNANFENFNFNGSQHDFGDVTYSATATTSTQHTLTNSWTAGFQSQGSSDKGFGPAWNVSINAGTGYTSGTVSTVQEGDPNVKQSLLDVGTHPPNQQLIPAGTAFGVTASIVTTAYRFLDADGNPICDGTDANAANQAPLFFTAQTIFTAGAGESFVPYTVTPGDLSSYTPEAWTARMQALGYKGTDYVADVIQANAYVFESGQNCLVASWGADANSPPFFQATSEQFVQFIWTFNASIYAGVSGGEGATIFGFGEDESFQFLVGGTYSATANTTTTTQQTWGILLSYPFGPPAVDDPLAMSSYTFEIYFLPPPAPPSTLPPNYWVQELQNGLQQAPPPPQNLPFDPLTAEQIDLGACPWKIAFVVTSYQSNDGSIVYPPPA